MPSAAFLHSTKTASHLSRSNLRAMLLAAGCGSFTADLSIPVMNYLPGTTDPYAQSVIQLVQGLQRLLNMRGSCLKVDGAFGPKTLAELVPYAGPRWYEKSWAQLYAEAINGTPWHGYKRLDRGLESWGPMYSRGNLDGFVDDVITSPLALVGIGALIYFVAKGRKRA